MSTRKKRPTRFLQALLWSLGFHSLLLLALSIKIFFLPPVPITNQVDVQLDLIETPSIATYDLHNHTLAKEALLNDYFIRMEPFLDEVLSTASLSSQELHPPFVRTYSPISLPWAPASCLNQKKASIYPLKMTLQYGLSSLLVLEDASSLFIPARDTTLQSTLLFAQNPVKVTFFASLNPKTGMIEKKKCDMPLHDTRLQKLACHILDMVRFQPKEGKDEIHGEITLYFAGNFDLIQPLLRTSAMKEEFGQ